MVTFIQKFLLTDLSKLFSKFGHGEFNFQNALELLSHDYRYTSIILSKLEKSGYISKRQDPSDGRRRIYKINKINFEDIMKEIGKKERESK
jgi:DNA-binding MarR family transcriptional regulator